MRLYTIYDRVADDYGPVLTAKTDGVAIRVFKAAMKDVASLSDFILFHVGDFEDGFVTGEARPRAVPMDVAAEVEA